MGEGAEELTPRPGAWWEKEGERHDGRRKRRSVPVAECLQARERPDSAGGGGREQAGRTRPACAEHMRGTHARAGG